MTRLNTFTHQCRIIFFDQCIVEEATTRLGRLAQLVERLLSMQEVAGSIPALSTFLFVVETWCGAEGEGGWWVEIDIMLVFFCFLKTIRRCDVWGCDVLVEQ